MKTSPTIGNNIADVLNDAYFLMTLAEDRLINYHEIVYLPSKEELYKYINRSYRGTVDEIVTTFSTAQLMKGQVYETEHRQGTYKSKVNILLVHKTNLFELYDYLDKASLKDNNGNRILLSEYMSKVKTSAEIKEIIDIFNSSWEQYWL